MSIPELSIEEVEEISNLDSDHILEKYYNNVYFDYLGLPLDKKEISNYHLIKVFREGPKLNFKITIDIDESFPLCTKHMSCSNCCDCIRSNICYCKNLNCENKHKKVIHELVYCMCGNIMSSCECNDYSYSEEVCYTCDKLDYEIYFTNLIISFDSELSYENITDYLETRAEYEIDDGINIKGDKDFGFELVLMAMCKTSRIKSARF